MKYPNIGFVIAAVPINHPGWTGVVLQSGRKAAEGFSRTYNTVPKGRAHNALREDLSSVHRTDQLCERKSEKVPKNVLHIPLFSLLLDVTLLQTNTSEKIFKKKKQKNLRH